MLAVPAPAPGELCQLLAGAGATPSFFCKLVDDVVYWKTSRFSG